MKHTLLATLLALWPSFAMADWHGRASVALNAENNVFLASVPAADLVIETSAMVVKDWEWEAWPAFVSYEVSHIAFTTHSDHDYLLHKAEAAIRRKLGKEGWVWAGSGGMFRIDHGEYAVFDYGEWKAFLDAKIPIGGRAAIFTGYRLVRRSYDRIAVLDNVEHGIFGRLHLPLDNGATVTLSSDAGYRRYSTPQGDSQPGALVAYRWQRAFAAETPASGSGQWVNSLSVSMPVIDDKTGLRAYVKLRTCFGEPPRLFSDPDSGHYAGDGLYDDRFSYESREFGGMLSRALPYAAIARVGYDQAIKDYRDVPIDSVGYPGLVMPGRNDNYRSLWARLEKNLPIGDGGMKANISAQCRQAWNGSSDVDYRYVAFTTTIGFELVF